MLSSVPSDVMNNLNADADPTAVAGATATVLLAFADAVRGPAPVVGELAAVEQGVDDTPTLILAELRKQNTLLEVLAKRRAGNCLILCGDVGTGKTHLAIGIAHVVLEQGGQAVFTSVMRAVRSVKETYAKGNSRTEAQAIADLVDPDLLILDEVGVQHGTDTEKLVLFEIINGRYEAGRPTIVISNLAIKALEEYLGARAFDRLREGGGHLVVCDWESYRSRRAA